MTHIPSTEILLLACTRVLPFVGALVTAFSIAAAVRAEDLPFRPMCALWDAHASEAIVRRVEESREEADLVRVSDAIFRMRRARRSCDSGWIMSACADYHAIVHRYAGTTIAWSNEVACPVVLTEELRVRMRKAHVARE